MQSKFIERRLTPFSATPWYWADVLLRSLCSNVVLASILPVDRPEKGHPQYELRWYSYAVLASTTGEITDD
jgi:hypothetical protein